MITLWSRGVLCCLVFLCSVLCALVLQLLHGADQGPSCACSRGSHLRCAGRCCGQLAPTSDCSCCIFLQSSVICSLPVAVVVAMRCFCTVCTASVVACVRLPQILTTNPSLVGVLLSYLRLLFLIFFSLKFLSLVTLSFSVCLLLFLFL